MTTVINAEGILTDPGLHDGLLLGVVLRPDGEELTLICQDADGRAIRITVPELERLRVDRFLQGNIIFEVTIREGDQCAPDSVKWAWSYDHNDEEDEVSRNLPEWMRWIKDDHWTLVEVRTSYGCDLFAVSRARADQIRIE